MTAARSSSPGDPAAAPLDWRITPLDAIAAWPAHAPLVALVSAPASSAWARWSILAAPAGDALDWAAMAAEAPRVPPALRRGRAPAAADLPPFAGGWIGFLSYDLGRRFEPKAAGESGAALDDRGWPTSEWRRCPGAYVHDALHDRWWVVGDASAVPRLDMHGGERRAALRVGAMTSGTRREAYIGAVAHAVERIHAGDVFQVNLAHRLSASFRGSPRALFRRMCRAMRPWYGALVECEDPGRAVVSASPELFLSGDLTRGSVITRPIKGTAPAREPAAQLARSEKDAAELVMIVDLMRNDLGRVADFGSVRVEEARAIERHGGARGVRHGVATVSARLRPGTSVGDLLRAAFPAGSITGAPKVRAMRLIDELEPVRRGPYCGSVGYVSRCGAFAFNVGIRTACLRGGAMPDGSIEGLVDYSVGAGIVADSDPAREWEETMLKAEGMFAAVAPRSRMAARSPA